MVARSKGTNGRVQSISWAFRSLGSLLGCVYGATFTFHANRFAFIALICLLGSVCSLRVKNIENATTTGSQFCRDFCSYIYAKKVLLFALVLFVYAYEPGDSSIVEFLLIKKFKATPTAFALTDMVSYVGLLLSSMFFNTFLRNANIYYIVITTNSIAFVLFFFRNFFVTERAEINPTMFMVTSAFLYAFIGQISFLPFIILSTKFSPVGMEGTVYSFFMAITNFAGIISRELSGLLTNAYEIRNTIEFDSEKMDRFYAVCAILDLLGLFIIIFLLKKVMGDIKVPSKVATTPRVDQSTHDEFEGVTCQNHDETLCSDEQEGLELVDVDLSDSENTLSSDAPMDASTGGI